MSEKRKKTDIEVKRERPATLPPSLRIDPFASLRDEIERLYEEFSWPAVQGLLPQRATGFQPLRAWGAGWAVSPAIDLVERDGEYEVQAELPGLSPSDLEIKLSDGTLILKGEKSTEESKDQADYHLRERSYGAFQRSFSLPSGIDAGAVSASFDNGVLRIRLPKSAEAKSKERKIEVKAGA